MISGLTSNGLDAFKVDESANATRSDPFLMGFAFYMKLSGKCEVQKNSCRILSTVSHKSGRYILSSVNN